MKSKFFTNQQTAKAFAADLNSMQPQTRWMHSSSDLIYDEKPNWSPGNGILVEIKVVANATVNPYDGGFSVDYDDAVLPAN